MLHKICMVAELKFPVWIVNEALVVKYKPKSCYYNSIYLPEMFSDTYFRAPFSSFG